MEAHDYFTVSVLPNSHREAMAFCGTKSGRDVDKFRACGLTVAYGAGDAPYIAESQWALVCKKLYAQDMVPESVVDDRVHQSYGAKGNWHRMYIGQVVEAYSNQKE